MPNLDRRFWITHAALPLGAFVLLATLLATTDIDPQIADRLFFDAAAGRFIGKDAWWASNLLHTGGRDMMRGVAAVALAMFAASYFKPRFRDWRRPAAFVATCLIGATLLVGTLKQVTNVDCPWDLTRYGGTRPFVHLFADRPDALPHAACFPGAHSSSGFALVCGYFLLRGRRPVAARHRAGRRARRRRRRSHSRSRPVARTSCRTTCGPLPSSGSSVSRCMPSAGRGKS